MKLMGIFLLIGLVSFNLTAKTAEQLRAAYLMQIPSFVKYKSSDARLPLINFCFVNQLGPVGSLIQQQQRSLQKRINFTLKILNPDDEEVFQTCHYLYLSDEVEKPIDVINQVSSDMITVAENQKALKDGATMALVQENNKIKIHINRTSLAKSDFTFRARLMALSEIADY